MKLNRETWDPARMRKRPWLETVLLLFMCGAIVLALGVRFVAARVIDERLWHQWQAGDRDAPFQFGDSASYWYLAQRIYRCEPYAYGGPDARIFRTPGYPALLAGWFTLIGDDDYWFTQRTLRARYAGATLGAITALLTYFLGRSAGGIVTGVLAALVVALYPGAIAMSVFLLSEAAFCPLLVVQLLLTKQAWRGSGHAFPAINSLLAGAVGGLATLVRPSWLLFTPAWAVAEVLTGRNRGSLVRAVAAVAGMVVVMAPWWYRNYQVVGHFVPTTLQVGASLYDGLSPHATGASDLQWAEEVARQVRAQAAGAEPLEYRIDRRLRDEAVAWAVAHPRRVVELAALKFARLWNIWPNEAEFRSWSLRLGVMAGYLPVIALAIVGGVLALRGVRLAGTFEPRLVLLCWLPACYFTALHVVFVSSLRYREPAMLPLAVVAAAAAVHLCGRGRFASTSGGD
ncbi:MAG: glycosyltransferase family 39 protein [Pirellulales bacterium]|nr:glycosyltransferase family 39 protein [Pirellulales bacterium]